MESTLDPTSERSNPAIWYGFALTVLVVIFFYQFIPGFGPTQLESPFVWLKRAWNAENRMEHGGMVPVISIALLIWHGKVIRSSILAPAKNRWGLAGLFIALFGALLFVAAHRSGQVRLALGGLPMILWGASWHLYGWPTARLTAFPFFIFWMAIPVPQFQQATTHLQVLSTKLAGMGCDLLGIETEVRGTMIFSVSDQWEPLEIDEGCGGIRSLMALIMISSVWAYISKMALWKKAVLCLSAIPLAIFGNMLRLTSIFMIGEYGNPEFARNTWHDWSGLILFYPISLGLLLLIHTILEGGRPKWRRIKRTTQKTVSSSADEAH